MVDFIGTGSAFNTKLGNNSAFLKKGSSLILIDCGGSVFSKLRKLNLLNSVEKIYIIITHTHPDHVGSLGDLIFYSYYILKSKVNIFFPQESLIKNFLANIGASSEQYNLNSCDNPEIDDVELGNINVKFLSVTHTKTIPAYGFIMNLDRKSFYYSGDSNSISNQVIDKLKNGEIEMIYHDTCGLDYKGNPHLSIKKLCEAVPMEFRNKVYCMHLDENITEKQIMDSGFNVVHPYFI
ncbi:MBL fold metallo-hydrolase [Clostridium guangxiense]|uniref:MBL fold metallo-hydrolase n=1 Tax=Clostridium guangxiense TaxID=1662055 RepID=UPI001E350B42|nr:MBL fold metallo-hydrolase [Clostridium guangxiense]MCD2348525.1 MBL fold metallo-hydrolase [Clostridium guangxiense]